jgi:hypothetical protein
METLNKRATSGEKIIRPIPVAPELRALSNNTFFKVVIIYQNLVCKQK